MALLTKNQILTADDLTFEDVPVPEWGGEVRIKTLTGHERDAFEGEIVKVKGNKRELNTANMRARLISKCAVDENGQLLFSPADVLKLGSKSAPALERVFEAASRMNGMGDEDLAEMVQDFGDDQSESSTSG